MAPMSVKVSGGAAAGRAPKSWLVAKAIKATANAISARDRFIGILLSLGSAGSERPCGDACSVCHKRLSDNLLPAQAPGSTRFAPALEALGREYGSEQSYLPGID